ncbi:MAG: hypothetical protein ACRELG_02510 [Gemmataceae bacterium]
MAHILDKKIDLILQTRRRSFTIKRNDCYSTLADLRFAVVETPP